MQFIKLFNSILDSTIWQEPAATRLVWITLMAMCNKFGEVHASVPGLAKRAGVTMEECESALECLLSPDQYSRTETEEGRRIRKIDGGWTLINHGKYRALLSLDERREYFRKKKAEYRARDRAAAGKSPRKSTKSPQTSNDVSDMSIESTHTDAEASVSLGVPPSDPLEGVSPPNPPLVGEPPKPPLVDSGKVSTKSPQSAKVVQRSKHQQVEADLLAANAVLLPLDLQTDEFRAVWAEWCEYRSEMYQRNKAKVWSARAAKNTMTECSRNGAALSVMAIRAAMANSYQGIVWEKVQPHSNGSRYGRPEDKIDINAREPGFKF